MTDYGYLDIFGKNNRYFNISILKKPCVEQTSTSHLTFIPTLYPKCFFLTCYWGNSHCILYFKLNNRFLENKLKLVEDLDQNILSLCEVDTIQNKIEDSEKVLERVIACQKSIQDALKKWKNESNARTWSLTEEWTRSNKRSSYQRIWPGSSFCT